MEFPRAFNEEPCLGVRQLAAALPIEAGLDAWAEKKRRDGCWLSGCAA